MRRGEVRRGGWWGFRADVMGRSVGFGVTGTTSYISPYQLVRSWSTLDHLTDGRIGRFSNPMF
jgi:hypothetical protein